MDRKRQSPIAAVTVGVLAVLLVMAGVYVAGYIAFCTFVIPVKDGGVLTFYRVYSTEWQATIFRPAARIQSLVTGSNSDTDAANYNWSDSDE